MSVAIESLPVSPERRGAGTGVKPIDLAYLRRFTLGNLDLEQEVLDLFATHADGYLDGMRSATTPKAWHEAAHTLKGSARAVGAWRVARAAEVAERLDPATDQARCTDAITLIGDAIDEAQHFIRLM